MNIFDEEYRVCILDVVAWYQNMWTANKNITEFMF